jgi:hypothetical protein
VFSFIVINFIAKVLINFVIANNFAIIIVIIDTIIKHHFNSYYFNILSFVIINPTTKNCYSKIKNKKIKFHYNLFIFFFK